MKSPPHAAMLLDRPKSKIHQVADYVQSLLGSAVCTYPSNIYEHAIDGAWAVKHREGEIREEELERIRQELKNIGCSSVSVCTDSLGRLRIRVEVDLP